MHTILPEPHIQLFENYLSPYNKIVFEEFLPDTTTKQCYRALGNSLNVHVVSVFLRLLVKGDGVSMADHT